MRKFLLLAAAATVLASCYDIREIGNDVKDNNEPTIIGFGTFTQKATRATFENLEDYHSTFAVWSTKKSNNNPELAPEKVFVGDSIKDIITYNSERMHPNHWTYTDYRYWDKQATYSFVAVAPNANIVRFNAPDDVANNGGTFVTTDSAGYTLIGQNLQTSAAPAEAEIKIGFKGGKNQDTDLMTSGKVTRNGAANVSDVNLEFKHILAKLNISIGKDSKFDNVKVIIDSVKVIGLDDTGTYFEQTSDATSAWISSLTNADYKLSWKNANGIELPNSETVGDQHVVKPLYFIESLVMPQTIEYKVEKLIVDYRIVSGDNTQKYNYVLNLFDEDHNLFANFMEKNNYTIKLTVAPNVIAFDACTEVWNNQDAGANIIPPVQQ